MSRHGRMHKKENDGRPEKENKRNEIELTAAENASPDRYRAAVFSGKEKRESNDSFYYCLRFCWRLYVPRSCCDYERGKIR